MERCAPNSSSRFKGFAGKSTPAEIPPDFGRVPANARYNETGENMKPLPPPKIEGKTEWERFDNAVRKILTVPKEVILKEEAKEQRRKERKRERKKRD